VRSQSILVIGVSLSMCLPDVYVVAKLSLCYKHFIAF